MAECGLGRKRGRVSSSSISPSADFVLSSGAAIQRIVTMLVQLHEEAGDETVAATTARDRMREELHRMGRISTPYGTLVQQSTIKGSDVAEMPFEFLNPFALMYYCAQVSDAFAKFHTDLANRRPCGRLRLVFYMDGATAGGELRPEPRKYNNIYWSFLEYPSWFRSGKCGWITFNLTKVTTLYEAGVSYSSVLRFVLKTFFNPEENEWNFSTVGVQLTPTFVLLADPGPYLADFEGHAQAFCLVGAQGRKACPFCKNGLWRCDVFNDHEYFLHLTSSQFHRFDICTDAAMRVMVEDISATTGGLPEFPMSFRKIRARV